jgi:probable rRNA maturation factor
MKIWIRNLQKPILLDSRKLRKAAKTILADLAPPDSEVSVSLVGDGQIRELNRRYLDRDKPTNVLAFSMREGAFVSLHPQLLGDVVISVDTARRQSNRFGLKEMEMVVLLMIHGILHLLGYEHEGTKKGSNEMALKQKELFRRVIKEIN